MQRYHPHFFVFCRAGRQRLFVSILLSPALSTEHPPLPNREIVLEQLRQDWPAAKALLERLVRLNSHTHNAVGIEANAQVLIEAFAPLGFTPRRIPSPSPKHSPHLILDNHAPGPTVLMVSHLDTVYTDLEQKSGFHCFETHDGFLCGPGTNDIKGGTVMMWMLARAWESLIHPDLPRTRWILAWNASEEELTPDFSRSVIEIVPPSTAACLVFEADNRKKSGHEVVISRKGLARWKIFVRGRGSHSGNAHEKGLNAIVRLARVVSEVSEKTDYSRGLTVNVGTIEGGVCCNRVPESASAEFEVRYLDPEDYQSLRSKLLELNDAGCSGGPVESRRCEVVMKSLFELNSWSGDGGTNSLLDVWRQAAGSCGQELTAGVRGGLSDANYFGRNFPTLDGLGPRGGNAHTVEKTADGFSITEYVEPDSFLTKGLINFFALHALIRGKEPQAVCSSRESNPLS